MPFLTSSMELTSHRWSEVRRIYEQALEIEEPVRATFIKQACSDDAELRAEIESLLAARDQAADFLDQPVVNLNVSGIGADAGSTRVGQRIGPYHLEAKIGQGGMGEVYRAVRADGEFDRQVAIKLVRGGFDTRTVLNRFAQEKQILAALQHPHIAQLLDAGATDEGIPYLVIEYVDGTPIDKYCDANKTDLRTRLGTFIEVCDTLQFAHQRLVVHRDLKPANILVTAGGAVKLLDFGIAKVLDSPDRAELTQTLMMTPAYASPEQIRGEAITTLSDVFSLGVLLYKLLAGTSPYSKDTTNAHSLAIEICDREPPSFASVPAAVPRDLELVVRKALRKIPGDRYSSVEEFARDIRRYLDGRPVLAAKGSALYRVRKFVGRNRITVTASLFALALAGGGIWEIVQQRQIAERRFNDVRQLANTIVFDVHDAIVELPGSTPARKIIVQRALEYLNRLEGEGAAKPELQRDMAAAYEKIANVQGATNSSNLGEIEGASRSYLKALATREAIVEAGRPSSTDEVALARILMRYSDFTRAAHGNVNEALEKAKASVAVVEKVVTRAPDDTFARTQLFDSQLQLADILGGSNVGTTVGRTADAARVFQLAEKNLAILIKAAPNDDRLKHKFVNVNAQLADLSRQLGQRNAALESLASVRRVLTELQQRAPSPRVQANLAAIDSRRGEVFLQDGDANSAFKSFRSQHDILAALLATDTKNANHSFNEIGSRANMALTKTLLGDVSEAIPILSKTVAEFEVLTEKTGSRQYREFGAFYRIWIAYALEQQGNNVAASRQLTLALGIFESAIAQDATSIDAAVSQTMTLTRLANLSAKLGDQAAATKLLERALLRGEQLSAKNPAYVDIDYALAEAYAAKGDLIAVANNSDGAKSWYEKSLAAWRRIPNPGRVAVNTFPIGSQAVVERKFRSLVSQ